MKHSDVVLIAAQWLKRKCPVVITELAVCGENPDAIGWHNSQSMIVECKVSRSDFVNDLKKPFRHGAGRGVGNLRYYMAPSGVIPRAFAETLGFRWGILEITDSKIRMIKQSALFEAYRQQELAILLSALRRCGQTAPQGVSIRCYTHETLNKASLSVEKIPVDGKAAGSLG